MNYIDNIKDSMTGRTKQTKSFSIVVVKENVIYRRLTRLENNAGALILTKISKENN